MPTRALKHFAQFIPELAHSLVRFISSFIRHLAANNCKIFLAQALVSPVQLELLTNIPLKNITTPQDVQICSK
jgi:hypothetical protein